MSTFDPELPPDDAGLEHLLRDQRFGPPAPDEATPWDFVRRWPATVIETRAWPIISRLLLDDDELVRARAVEFVRLWRDGARLTTPRLIDVAEKHSDRFGDQRPEGITLRSELAHALADRSSGGAGRKIAGILRRLAADEPVGGGAASVLGEFEPTFVITQVGRWGDEAIGWLEEAARSLAMFQRDSIVSFLEAARHLGDEARTRLLAAVEAYVKRDDAVAATLARGEGLAAPARPAPTTDDCRRAIGLMN